MLKHAVAKGYAVAKGQRKKQVKEVPNVKRRIQERMRARRRVQQSRASRSKIVKEGLWAKLRARISFRLRLRKRYFVRSELYSMDLKNNGIMRCNQRAWIAKVKLKYLTGTLLFEQRSCIHRQMKDWKIGFRIRNRNFICATIAFNLSWWHGNPGV